MTNTHEQINQNTAPCPYKRDALYIALDLTRQLITLAVVGIVFMAGSSYVFPTLSSTSAFGLTIVVFGMSAGFGLLFQMRATGEIDQDKTYNVYSPALRICSATQILLLVLGIILLCYSLQVPADKPCEIATSTDMQNTQHEQIPAHLHSK